MIVSSLVGASLIVSAALHTGEPANPASGTLELSIRQKDAALLPLVQNATECVIRAVSEDADYHPDVGPAELNDLIVQSMQACVTPVRDMIDAHDRMFGAGSGDAFFLGPYLDVLPAAVGRHTGTPRAQQRPR